MIKSITITSQDPKRLYHFLSFIFDVEDTEVSDCISLDLFETRFCIVAGEVSANQFVIGIETLQQLEDLKSKYEFFIYKDAQVSSKVSLIENQLDFFDFEERKWSFSLI